MAGLVNRTIIEANATHLRTHHGPVPWLGSRKALVEALQQLFCEGRVVNRSLTYSLSAVLKNGRKLTLVKSLPEADQTLLLEHALERHLGIIDQPVPGELRV